MLLIAIIIVAGCCAVSGAVLAATTIGARAQRASNRDVRREAGRLMQLPAAARVQRRTPDASRGTGTGDPRSERDPRPPVLGI